MSRGGLRLRLCATAQLKGAPVYAVEKNFEVARTLLGPSVVSL